MILQDRIDAFAQLGNKIASLSQDRLKELTDSARNENPWFTLESTVMAFQGISEFLTKETLQNWASNYSLSSSSGKKIGVAMAGNIPLVGFHDLLCVLLSGHQLVAKL